MPLARALLLPLIALVLAGCGDPRRQTALAHLTANPPAGFRFVVPPTGVTLLNEQSDTAEAVAAVRLRLENATVEPVDALTLPAARAPLAELTELRGWALTALPATHPLRTEILTAVAAARQPFPAKRVVTPAGAEFETLATLTLRRDGRTWRVESTGVDARVPGVPDTFPERPRLDGPEVTARLAEITATAERLRDQRREFVARQAAVRESLLGVLRQDFRAGRTFTGIAPDGRPLRVIVTRDLGETAGALTLTWGGEAESTARAEGRFSRDEAGTPHWESDPAQPIAGNPPAGARVILRPAEGGVRFELVRASGEPTPITLQRGAVADLLPEP